jgi:predicted GNAT family acetyltransferase
MPPVVRTLPIRVVDDPSRDRYELYVEGALAATANYGRNRATIVLRYTELMAGFEGRGLGQHLATAVLDDVRQRGLVVVARCPFFSTFIEDHPAYCDLVDPPLAAAPLLRVAGA